MKNIFSKSVSKYGLLFVFTFATVTGSVAVPTITKADWTDVTVKTNYTLLEPLPCIQGKEGASSTIPCTPGQQVKQVNFKDYVQYVFNLIIALAAVAAVFVMVYGGFEYMTSLSASGKSEGLTRAKNAIMGLVLVLASFLILRTIDPRLVEIPSTFLPQLQLKCPDNKDWKLSDPRCKSNTLSLFDKLSRDADAYNIEIRDVRSKVDQINAEVKTLEQQRKTVQDRITSYAGGNRTADELCQYTSGGQSTGDSEIDAMCLQLLSLDDRIATGQNESNTTAAIGLIEKILARNIYDLRIIDGTIPSSSLGNVQLSYKTGFETEIAQDLLNIDSRRNDYKTLVANDSVASQKIDNEADYAKAYLEIQRELYRLYSGKWQQTIEYASTAKTRAQDKIQEIANRYAPLIKDADLQKKLTERRDTAKEAVRIYK